MNTEKRLIAALQHAAPDYNPRVAYSFANDNFSVRLHDAKGVVVARGAVSVWSDGTVEGRDVADLIEQLPKPAEPDVIDYEVTG